MPSFTFSKTVQRAGFQFQLGQFWFLGLMFDTTDLIQSLGRVYSSVTLRNCENCAKITTSCLLMVKFLYILGQYRIQSFINTGETQHRGYFMHFMAFVWGSVAPHKNFQQISFFTTMDTRAMFHEVSSLLSSTPSVLRH